MANPFQGYQQLGSALAGGNQLNTAMSQAQGELLGANTQNALLQAERRRMENTALTGMKDTFSADPAFAQHADVAAAMAQGGMLKDYSDLAGGTQKMQDFDFANQIADPNATPALEGINRRLAAQGKPMVHPTAVGAFNYSDPLTGTVSSTPEQQAAVGSLTDLRGAQGTLAGSRAHLADVQSAHPELFHPVSGSLASLPQEDQDAMTQAIADGRLSPSAITRYNTPWLVSTLTKNPQFDVNAAVNNFKMGGNASIATRNAQLDALPSQIDQTAKAGEALDFSSFTPAAAVQGFMAGTLQDPRLIDYMTRRNDLVQNMANALRNRGATNQAVQLEQDAMGTKYVSPPAFKAWAGAQLGIINTMRNTMHAIGHAPLNAGPGGAATAAAPSAASPADPLGIR